MEIYYLDCSDGFMGVWNSSNVSKLYALNICRFLYINYTSIKLFKKTPERYFPGGAVVKKSLPMQGTGVRALVWEDPTCCRATKP